MVTICRQIWVEKQIEIPIGALLDTTTPDGHIVPLAANPHDNKLLDFLPCETKIKKTWTSMKIMHTVVGFDSLSNKWIICESNSTLVLHGS